MTEFQYKLKLILAGDKRKMNDIEGIIEDCYKSDLVSDKIIKKVIEIIGQKEWQILHDENNDICTTMGELIITLDGIVDLEKENAELKEQVEKMKCCDNCKFGQNRCYLKDGTGNACEEWEIKEK